MLRLYRVGWQDGKKQGGFMQQLREQLTMVLCLLMPRCSSLDYVLQHDVFTVAA